MATELENLLSQVTDKSEEEITRGREKVIAAINENVKAAEEYISEEELLSGLVEPKVEISRIIRNIEIDEM